MAKRAADRLDEAEIKRVVDGLVRGQIFTASDCPPDMIGMVFMPVLMGGLSEIDLDTVGTVYEWMDKANELAVNGYPTFFSCKVVHVDDWQLILETAVKVEKAMKAAMG